jgi:hypothetical protein
VMFDHRFSSLGATTYSPSNPIPVARAFTPDSSVVRLS